MKSIFCMYFRWCSQNSANLIWRILIISFLTAFVNHNYWYAKIIDWINQQIQQSIRCQGSLVLNMYVCYWAEAKTEFSVRAKMAWRKIHSSVSNTLHATDELCRLKTALSYRIQSNLGSRTPRIMNNSVYEQIFRTQSVSDDVLCLDFWTRKPSTSWSDKLGV
jgi:hypothetical protein